MLPEFTLPPPPPPNPPTTENTRVTSGRVWTIRLGLLEEAVGLLEVGADRGLQRES